MTEERLRYYLSSAGSGASRGGGRKSAALAPKRVHRFVADQFRLPR